MCEQVNINVSETNETINIVSSEIQEVIDINVFETAEDVTLNITEQLIQVNVNKVTAAEQIQSDWNQTDVDALDFIKNKPTSTSDFINDGEDGVNPFITAADIPPVTGFVPYTGATENVDLGEYELKAGQVEFDQTPTGTAGVGVMRWNDSDGTVDLGLKGGNVTLQIGQESVLRVVNKTATNINLLEANYQAVRVTGAQGQRLKVDLAQATTDNLSAETIGLVTETINNNQEGFITTGGIVRNINTTGSLQGETWADGDILYLSPTTAGNATKVKPTAPNHLVILGYVIHAHITQGSIFVKVDNGYELDELHNVKITSAGNNNVLAYTSATDIWENKTINTVIGYTPFQLPALTSGSVLFSDGTTIAQDNANLFWDDTNNRLGIGTNAPTYNLDILSTGTPVFRLKRGTTTELRFSCFSGGAYIGTYNSSPLIFTTNSTDRATIFANGNFAIGTTTDGGFKLDVNGTARIKGASNLGTTTAFTVTNSDSVNVLQVQDNGYIRIGSQATSAFRVYATDASGDSEPSGLNLALNSRVVAQTTAFNLGMVTVNGINGTATTGNQNVFLISKGFAPTSGTCVYAASSIIPTINQTGTATGITRGLYINPTLTSAADFRAIEVASGITILGASTTAKASLRIPSGTAPTTPTNGDIWFDGTDLKIRVAGVTRTIVLL
jgi:hypothetical protein